MFKPKFGMYVYMYRHEILIKKNYTKQPD